MSSNFEMKAKTKNFWIAIIALIFAALNLCRLIEIFIGSGNFFAGIAETFTSTLFVALLLVSVAKLKN